MIEYALLLADALNLSDQEKQSLQLASLLHNIGIVSIPDTILNMPGPLSTEERKIIQAHVLGVVEAYHAMISVRPYRPKMLHGEALGELRKNAGTQFDPEVVRFHQKFG